MIPDLCQWNLDSRSQLFEGFRIPNPRILDYTSKNFPDFPVSWTGRHKAAPTVKNSSPRRFQKVTSRI